MGKILLVVLIFAALVYGFFWLMERRRSSRPSPRPTSRPGSAPKRVVAPDDDEEFLRELEQRRRRAAREQRKPDGPTTGPSASRPSQPDDGASPGSRDPERRSGEEKHPGERKRRDQDDPKPEGPADKNRSKPD